MVMSLPPIPPVFALGVCDYPEHVPWEQWRHYPERQRELGITYVRFELFDGKHGGIEYRYPLAIRYLAERLQ